MPESQGSPGPATDRHNSPVIDPTANVIALVAANDRRQDDLRGMVAAHLKEIVTLRAAYDADLRKAESNRIDAIRLVDTGNVARAAEVSAAQATALATAQIQSAEALRVQVEATRITTQDALTTALQPIQGAIEDLRKTQFQQQGEKAASIESLRDTRYDTGQRRDSAVDARTLFFAVCGLALAIITAAALIGAHL
jgi:hypothetical protein